jgi:ankyrin repeat protein
MKPQFALAVLAAGAVAGGALFVARHGSAGPSSVSAPEHRSLVDAAKDGDTAAALAALKAGADVNARGADGTTALMWAAYNADAELAKRLIAAGADVEARNDFGAFALSEAAMTGSTPVINALLAGGAKAGGANAEGETALMEVARRQPRRRKGAHQGRRGREREGSLGRPIATHVGCGAEPAEMIKLLLASGADVNARGMVPSGNARSSRSRARRT